MDHNFIKVVDNVLNDKECEFIIQTFKMNEHTHFEQFGINYLPLTELEEQGYERAEQISELLDAKIAQLVELYKKESPIAPLSSYIPAFPYDYEYLYIAEHGEKKLAEELRCLYRPKRWLAIQIFFNDSDSQVEFGFEKNNPIHSFPIKKARAIIFPTYWNYPYKMTKGETSYNSLIFMKYPEEEFND